MTDPINAIVDVEPARQLEEFVTFEMEGECYAFPMSRVKEIIRMPALIRVPSAPPELQGVTNLRGRIVPVVDLRACCGLPSVEPDSASRVIVVEGVAVVGLTVDRVSSVLNFSVSQVERSVSTVKSWGSEQVGAVLRAPTGMVTALDIDQILHSRFDLLTTHGRIDYPSVAPPVVEAAADEDECNTIELVACTIDEQEYAFPVCRVQEILQAPEQVGRLPNASHHLLGVLDLRGEVMPLLSVRRLFGLPDAPADPEHRVIVVSLAGGQTVGLLMDTVREVVEVDVDLIVAVPEGLGTSGGRTEVESICRLDGGQRLVSVLNVDQMFPEPHRLSAGIDQAGTGQEESFMADTDTDLNDDDYDDHGDDEMLVVFRLDGECYAVDIEQVQEIIRVPRTLVRVPNAHAAVEGLVNLRGSVLPVIDLRSRLGLARLAHDDRQRIIVMALHGARTGFVVDAVTEVARVSRSVIQPAPELSARQAGLVSRVARPADGRMFLVVDAAHLMPQPAALAAAES